MADVNANIGVNIDTSNALAQIKNLQRQLSEFYTSISRSSETAALAQRDLQRNLINSINSLGGFSAELRTVKTTAESFTSSLEKNKFSMREYFRYAAASTKTFGKLFTSEFDTISKVAEDNVKRLQTQYIKLGRDSTGAMKAIAIMPTELNMNDLATKTQLAAQRQAIFNKLVQQGSTNLLNFGKNTQWAGRQLMVGFTIPLSILGNTAAKAFMEMETAAIKFKKVYGDLGTTPAESQAQLDSIQELAKGFTKYGVAAAQTVQLAADAAAAGFKGVDLQRQTAEATRLSVLGQIDQQKALETTIALQNAFKMSSEDLASTIDFLNAVENQTVTSLDDITTAIPKAGPVVEQLGGNVKDLAFFMTAMKEGGINASEGANALKSGLAALINPTAKASAMLADMGINIKDIVERNRGNLKATVIEFANALNQLAPLERARAIEQLFGKFQFARLSTLFQNVTRDGTQAARVLDLAGSSVADLASLSQQELGITADSPMMQFKKAVEDLKISLIPLGKTFLESATPIIQFVGKILDKFNDLSDGTKRIITVLTVTIGAIGPVALMAFGLIANAIANGIKFIDKLRLGYLRLTGQSKVLGEQSQFLTVEQQNAAAVAHSLDQSHAKLIQTFNVERQSLQQLASAYNRAATAASNLLLANPGILLPGRTPKKYADGVSIVPGTGSTDSVPAMLTPGEAVIPKTMTKKYGKLINAMISDKIPGYVKGRPGTGGTRVEIPGGFAAAHFGGSRSMTGNDLLAMLEGRTDKVAQSLRKMVEAMGSSDKEITVFTNEVVGMSSKLNQAVGKTGSGKKVSAEFARQELTSIPKSQVRDIELQRQLEKAGVPIQEIRVINQKITDEITKGFTELGDITEVTAEDLDKLISTAYKKVAETDARVDAAYKNMQEITSLTDPTNNARRPITKESYKEYRKNNPSTGKSAYFEGMERMVGPGNVPFNPEAEFRITPSMGKSLGLSTKDASLIYAKFSDEVKLKLSKLRGDITAFTAEFEKQAEVAGIKTAQGYKKGLDANLKDIYYESRERQSPHPLASKDGTDDGNAYETARQNAVKRRRAASSPGGTVGPGGVIIPPIPPVGGGGGFDGPEGPMYGPRKPTRFDRTFGSAAGRLRSFGANFSSGKYAGVGMAASTAVFAAQMMPGKAGELAQKITPAVFGLQALQMALKLPIPHIKAFAAVALAGVGIFKLVNAAREKERMAIEGLADAATLTKDKLNMLGGFFGVTPTASPFKTDIPQLVVSQQKRTELEQLKGNEGFQKTFAKDIKTLKGASDKEAELIFKSLAVSLGGQGFAQEQIQTIIDALREEAGKTKVQLDVKSLDLKTKEGQASLKKGADDIINQFTTTFKNGFEKKMTLVGAVGPNGQMSSKWVEQLMPTKELKKQSKAAGQEVSNFIDGISGQFRNGVIGAKEFNQSFDTIKASITALNATSPEAAMMLMANVMSTLPEKARKAAEGVKTLDGQMLLLKMQALGLTSNLAGVADALKILQNPLSDVSDRIKAQKTVDDAIKQTIEYSKKLEAELKKAMGTGLTGGNTAASAFANLKKQLLENIANTRNQMVAYDKLRKSGIGISQSLELSKDPLLAMVLATTKSKKEFDAIIKLIKTLNKETDKGGLKNFLEGLKAENTLKKQFLEVIPLMEKMGLQSDEIMSILNDPSLAEELVRGLNQAKDKAAFLKTYIDQIVQKRKLQIEIEISTIQGKISAVQGAASKAIRSIDARGSLIRRAAETGNYTLNSGKDFSTVAGLTSDQMSRLSSINLSQRRAEVTAAQNAVKDQQKVIAGIQAGISAKQHSIDLNNLLISQQQQEIDKINKKIEAEEKNLKIAEDYIALNFDKPLKKLSDESNVLSNALSQIEYQSKKVNEQYDKQLEALDAQQKAMEQVNKLNEESIQQGKTKMSIADALSKGDIGAAAQAMQELSAQEAAAQGSAMQDLFGASRTQIEQNRKNAIDSLTANGMTRAQIEERQYQIQQESFKLEQAKAAYYESVVIPIQERITKLEAEKIPYQNEINRLTALNEDLQRQIEQSTANELYNAQQTLDELEKTVDEKEAALEADEAIVDEIIKQLEESEKTKEEWEKINDEAEAAQAKMDVLNDKLLTGQSAAEGIKSALEAIANSTYTTTVVINQIVNTTYTSSGSSGGYSSPSPSGTGDNNLGGGGGGGDGMQMKAFGGKILRRAGGGITPGQGLLDKVPALLTPGEFVINKQASAAYEPLLKSINQLQYPQIESIGNTKYPQVSGNRGLATATQHAASAAIQKAVAFNDNSSEVYNYSIGFNITESGDAESVAQEVLRKIKEVENRTVRRRATLS